MNQKVALVTGSSSGFGLLITLALAKAGFHVVATMRDLTKKNQLLEKAEASGVLEQIECAALDVTDPDSIYETVTDTLNKHGTIGILVNNAGFAAGGFIEEVPMETWRRQFETNVFGLIDVTKAVLPSMREAGSGTIINMSSISGRIALPGLGPYSASKFAIEGFSEALRLEMEPYGVHVVLIEPGSYQTAIWSKGLDALEQQELSAYAPKTARLMKRVRRIAETAGDPEDVAKLVADVAELDRPDFRYPIGKGVKQTVNLKHWLPWKWIERTILKKMS